MSWPSTLLHFLSSSDSKEGSDVESVDRLWEDLETLSSAYSSDTSMTSSGLSTPDAASDVDSIEELDLEPIPIVIVQGFLGTTGVFSWDHHIYKHHDVSASPGRRRRRILNPSVGPVSSLHDRACEMFYSLIGGTVDYGVEHSTQHKHERYGRHISEGLYPRWSREHPLHFVGHSIGGPTIIKLQHLLAQGFFGEDYHPDMILSVNTVCAPFRGTQFVYTLGESTTSAPAVRSISVGNFIGKVVHLLAYFGPHLPSSMDVHADGRRLSYRDIGPLQFLKHLWKTDWSSSHDAAPFDVTFQASDEREANGEGIAHANTFYRSFASVSTGFTSSIIRGFNFDGLSPRPSFCKQDKGPEWIADSSQLRKTLGDEYYSNDGVVPLFSQWHPFPCSETSCQHHTSGIDASQPGIWHISPTGNVPHVAFTPRPLGPHSEFQISFWAELLCWLDLIEQNDRNDMTRTLQKATKVRETKSL